MKSSEKSVAASEQRHVTLAPKARFNIGVPKSMSNVMTLISLRLSLVAQSSLQALVLLGFRFASPHTYLAPQTATMVHIAATEIDLVNIRTIDCAVV